VIAASVTDHFGMPTLFLYTAAVHIGLAVFTFARIRTTASPPRGERYAPMPAQASPAALELDPRGERHEPQAQTV
jgi:hypothetical protein